MITKAQQAALEWLKEHNGTGVFDKTGVLLAAGERAPFMRSTWNALRDAGLIDMWRIGNRGPARVAVSADIKGRT
jgi:hypothetical protein